MKHAVEALHLALKKAKHDLAMTGTCELGRPQREQAVRDLTDAIALLERDGERVSA